MDPLDNVDRAWRVYAGGERFAELSQNGDDCATITFVRDQVGGDGKPLNFTDEALAALHASLGDYLRCVGNRPQGGPADA